ncbi:hypothetical protein [Enterococcus raffinosus]|uniref:Uncharacterized protein n=1 Tax=Enterococcus raffinosus ATCC 49464 TaxID=1158602 RepID=R2QXR5_9ENTE|nr:hypothetical protein [Enterococcus raffinosus]EOH76225.1 hypothetical protein UAK_03075 [Enterococcus raffinosus ATCC 49464]EOT76192.1 hypothetical protein I590_03018 [Enterococcus raffinosus ATCC 49464]UXK02890.1 hypothetical protein N7K38_09500 [Enterococcus raffinosus]
MMSMSGSVSSIKILKFSERPLVYFKLDDQSCLIASHSLSFLADVENGMRIAVAGEYNSRKQFVVKKYAVIGKTRIMMEITNNIIGKF